MVYGKDPKDSVMKRLSILVCSMLVLSGLAPRAWCQLVNTGGGPGTIESQVAALDFGELRMHNQDKAKKELEEAQNKAKAALVESGTVSALDLTHPLRPSKSTTKASPCYAASTLPKPSRICKSRWNFTPSSSRRSTL